MYKLINKERKEEIGRKGRKRGWKMNLERKRGRKKNQKEKETRERKRERER